MRAARIYLLPWLTDDLVVCLDGTYFLVKNESNGWARRTNYYGVKRSLVILTPRLAQQKFAYLGVTRGSGLERPDGLASE